MLFALLMARREIGVAIDDLHYLSHFEGSRMKLISVGEIPLFKEPLWAAYTYLSGEFFGPEFAFRMTIFLSVYLFLISLHRLLRINIIVVLLIFILEDGLITQFYFNQIRQGFALSIFLFFFSFTRGTYPGALTALLIHISSVVFLLGALMQANFSNLFKALLLVVLISLGLSLFDDYDVFILNSDYFEGQQTATWLFILLSFFWIFFSLVLFVDSDNFKIHYPLIVVLSVFYFYNLSTTDFGFRYFHYMLLFVLIFVRKNSNQKYKFQLYMLIYIVFVSFLSFISTTYFERIYLLL